MPSHHQQAFFEALGNRNRIKLQIRFYDKVSMSRIKLGWDNHNTLPENQSYIPNRNVMNALETISNWRKSIHIVPGFSHPFLKELLAILIEENVNWIHWSERSGKPFTKLLNYNYSLVKLIYPIFLWIKGYYSYSKKINKYGLGSFAVSSLAYNDFILWGVKSEKIRLLNYSLKPLIDLPTLKFDPFFEKNKQAKYFIYVGSLTKHKGIEPLLRSFLRLQNSEGWMLILVGDDHSNGYYQKLTDALKLKSKVYFTGAVNHKKVYEYINSAHILILPTLFDGWGAVLNEAASLSKPLISTDQCGAAFHLIEQNENGFRVKANSVKSLTIAMQFYIKNPDLIELHGKKSLELFQKNSPEETAKKFEENILELLAI